MSTEDRSKYGGTGREELEGNTEAAEKDSISTLSKLSVCVLKMARMKNEILD